MGGPFFIPKGITTHVNVPQSITKVVLYLSPSAKDIL